MKNAFTISLAVLLFSVFTSCKETVTGEGPVVEQRRNLEPFSKIAFNMNTLLEVRKGDSSSVVIRAQGNLMDNLITRIDGRTLVVTNKGNVLSDEPIVIEITMSQFESFELNGSGEIIFLDLLHGDYIDFEVNGPGLMSGELGCHKVTASITGSGTMKFSGDAKDFSGEIGGSGTIDASELIVASARATISGSGDISLHVISDLDVTLNGSGTIRYKGHPTIKSTINGSGKVVAVE